MTARQSSHLVTVALLGLGVALWTYGARQFNAQKPKSGATMSLRFKPNPLGLKMSAYGQVIAMAMHGPIDLFWHKGEAHHHHHHHHDGHDADRDACSGHDHLGEHLADHCDEHADACPDCGGVAGQHAPGCSHGDDDTKAIASSASQPLRKKVKAYLKMLGQGANHRTNPRPDTAAHKFYLRRQIESRLRIAYEFDPSNYGTYNSYHLFLTNSSLGTTKEGVENAMWLSRVTIDYCLRQPHDPRPALTAAAAAHDILALMFREHINKPLNEYKRVLQTEGSCLNRYLDMIQVRRNDGTLDLISNNRQAEMAERFRLLMKLREADEATIRRIFGQTSVRQAGRTRTTSES